MLTVAGRSPSTVNVSIAALRFLFGTTLGKADRISEALTLSAKFRDAMLDALARGALVTPEPHPDDALDLLRKTFFDTAWVV